MTASHTHTIQMNQVAQYINQLREDYIIDKNTPTYQHANETIQLPPQVQQLINNLQLK